MPDELRKNTQSALSMSISDIFITNVNCVKFVKKISQQKQPDQLVELYKKLQIT